MAPSADTWRPGETNKHTSCIPPPVFFFSWEISKFVPGVLCFISTACCLNFWGICCPIQWAEESQNLFSFHLVFNRRTPHGTNSECQTVSVYFRNSFKASSSLSVYPSRDAVRFLLLLFPQRVSLNFGVNNPSPTFVLNQTKTSASHAAAFLRLIRRRGDRRMSPKTIVTIKQKF